MSEWSGDPGPSTIAGILSVSERFAQEILDFVENDFYCNWSHDSAKVRA